MTRNSRFPGFYRLSLEERRRLTAEALGLDVREMTRALSGGGIDCATADKTIENVVGTYALPFAFGLNIKVNGVDYVAPMVIEEPSVVAAASNAARIVRDGGGFHAEADLPIMISQVQLDDVADPASAARAIVEHKAELIALANRAVPSLVARGGGAVDLETRDLGDGIFVVHILVDCRDAMGANLVNTVAEEVAPRIASLTRGRMGLRILSNLSDQRCVRVRASIPVNALSLDAHSGEEVRDGIVRASRFAERDVYRATTHNKGVMNGVDAVVVATGNDWRAVEAGAHAYAARSGRYSPLCTWRVGDDGSLLGYLEMPLALGIVGGPSRVHQGARVALQACGVKSAQELAMVVACVGMASNLAALRALATDGIQRGHMLLHARTVAIAVGAVGDLVERVAEEIHLRGNVTMDGARLALARLTGNPAVDELDSARVVVTQ
ncbi:MAG: hydroxymethylglutaryl-CoA reductase, degradative [Sandaracinaceae bacterium]|jgi:hydroxymethylglutaryl-CoA reductase|nr:hydroxymethylglutaryl-CoA reductase, degradative [Sandaracinaceae bacterium]